MQRMKKAEEYLKYISDKIHHSIVATVDDEGLPVTSAIDMMDSDERGLYFLTAKGKGIYQRLKRTGYISLTAMEGKDTLSSVAISVRGYVKEIGPSYLSRLFEKNRYMYEIYPSPESRKALTVFLIYKGSGEYFDLSKSPIERASFSFGGEALKTGGFYISDECSGCGICISSCPQNAIDTSSLPFRINNEHCLHCGRCMEVCPNGVVKRKGL